MAIRYHYQIVSSFDPTDIPVDSTKLVFSAGDKYDGSDTYEYAQKVGEILMSTLQYNPDQYYVKVIPVTE